MVALALQTGMPAHASALGVCDEPATLNATQKDRLLRFGALIKTALEDSGQTLALISRSGLDLDRFGVRYSHAGVSLQASANTPWSVRQLYYDCDQGRPRLFDQGIAGFLLGVSDPSASYISIVLLPPVQAAALETAVLDNRRALQLLGGSYSANAYAFSTRHQNCNQWLVELLASAWGGLEGASAEGASEGKALPLRDQAQAWLRGRGYAPTVFEAGALMGLTAFIPWLHRDDHPAEDLERFRFRVSMPASMESFVRATVPGAIRLEFCQTAGRIVQRRGWEPLGDGCAPRPGDTVTLLD
jgi:hypothetical protein